MKRYCSGGYYHVLVTHATLIFTSYPLISCEIDFALCQKPFNQVAILGAHNISYGRTALTRNQAFSFKQLLNMGARFFKLPLHRAPLEILLPNQEELKTQSTLSANIHDILHKGDMQHFIPVVCHGLYRSEIYGIINDVNQRIQELINTDADGGSPVIHKENVLKQQMTSHANTIATLQSTIANIKNILKQCKWYKPSKRCFSYMGNLVSKQADLLKEQTVYNVLKAELDVIHKGHNLLDTTAHKIIDINTKIEKELRSALGTEEKEGYLGYTACFVDPASIPLMNILYEIKLYLERNSSTVIMILLEETIKDLDIIANHFKFLGLDKYAHEHIKGQQWATYQTMITTNKRLVIMIDAKVSTEQYNWKKYPWIHQWSDYWVGPKRWGIKSYEELMQYTQKDYAFDDSRPDQLFIIGNEVAGAIAGNIDEARKVNTYKAITERMTEIIKEAGRIPTTINFDFIGIPTVDDQLKAIRHINGIREFAGYPLVAFTPISPTIQASRHVAAAP